MRAFNYDVIVNYVKGPYVPIADALSRVNLITHNLDASRFQDFLRVSLFAFVLNALIIYKYLNVWLGDL